MVKLNRTDAAILARVAKYPRLGPVRRRQMLAEASPAAKAVGEVLITRREAGVEDDYARAAHNIMEWAGDEVPEPVADIAYAGH